MKPENNVVIFGIGCDILYISRIEKLLNNYSVDKINSKFLSRKEIENIKPNISQREHATMIAKSFAIKEACVKAFGTGFTPEITLQDFAITRKTGYSPQVEVSENLNTILLNNFGPYKILVSISDDYPLVLTYVNLVKG